MAAPGPNNSNSKYHLKFKQQVRTVNGRNVYLIPQGIPNSETNEINKNRQYEKYERYMGYLKNSMIKLNEELRKELRVFRNEEIIGAPDGIYTWIIKNDNFYAIRVFTQQEIGTLHLDLDRYTRHEEGNISSAGELKLEKSTIQFNLQSGTYTAKINGFQLIPDIAYLFRMLQGTTLFNEVQQDANKITDIIKENENPEIVEITEDEIISLLRKRTPEDIKPIQQRIKNRIMLYKRDRMIEAVRSKICSFFQCSNVKFIYSGSENHATINSAFIETGDVGHEFEVTAGKSLLVHDPIITTEANLTMLKKSGLFKEGRIRNFMSRRHYPTKLTHNKPNINTRKAKKRK